MALTTKGIVLPVGYTTAAEIKELQRSLGVTADGVFGPITKAAYDERLKEAAVPVAQPAAYSGYPSSAPSSDPSLTIQYYKDALAAAQAAQNTATAAAVSQYEAVRPTLAQNYANANTVAQNTARLSAIGNNEYLAAKGMAGNLYAMPQSGMSETSRIAGDVSMQSAMNMNQQDYTTKLAELETTIAAAKAAGDQRLAEIASEYYIMIAQVQATAQQNAISNYYAALAAEQNQTYDLPSTSAPVADTAAVKKPAQKKPAAKPKTTSSSANAAAIYAKQGKGIDGHGW